MTDPADVPLVDAAVLDQLRMLPGESGPDLVGELVELFAANAAETLSQLRGAVERGAGPEAVRLAHSLVGSAATLGASGVAGLARRLEALAKDARLDLLPPLIAEADAMLARTLPLLRGRSFPSP